MKNYYTILNLKENATDEEIKLAYRTLAKKYHPDVATSQSSTQMFSDINEAHDVLSDATKRAAFDKELAESRKPKTNPNPSAARPNPMNSNAQGAASAGGASSSQVDEVLRSQSVQVANYLATVAGKMLVGMDTATIMRVVKNMQQAMFPPVYKLGVDAQKLGYNCGISAGKEKGIREERMRSERALQEQQRKNQVQLNDELAAKARQTAQLRAEYEATIARLNNEIEQLNGSVSANDLLIGDLNDKISDYEGIFLANQDVINGKDEAISDLNAVIAQKDKELAQKDKQIAEGVESYKQITFALESERRASEGARNMFKQKEIELNNRCSELNNRINDANRKTAEVEKRLEQATKMLNEAFAAKRAKLES